MLRVNSNPYVKAEFIHRNKLNRKRYLNRLKLDTERWNAIKKRKSIADVNRQRMRRAMLRF